MFISSPCSRAGSLWSVCSCLGRESFAGRGWDLHRYITAVPQAIGLTHCWVSKSGKMLQSLCTMPPWSPKVLVQNLRTGGWMLISHLMTRPIALAVRVWSASHLCTSIHRHSLVTDMGRYGVSLVEHLIINEQSALHTLRQKKSSSTQDGPNLFWFLFHAGATEIRLVPVHWQLAGDRRLPGGLGRFLSCSLGVPFSRLRHLGVGSVSSWV